MCRVVQLSEYQLSVYTLFALEALLHAIRTHLHSSLHPIYQLYPLYAAVFRRFRRPVTKLFPLVGRKFLFCAISSSFRIFTGIHFR